MCLAEALDRGASIVNDVIPIPWTAGDGCDHGEVASTNQDLRIARPSIVLRLGRVAVIACRDQGSVHHPREPSIRRLARNACGELRRDGGDDSMDRGLRDASHGGKLAHGQVGTKRDAGEQDAMLERPRRSAPSRPDEWQTVDELSELDATDARQLEPR